MSLEPESLLLKAPAKINLYLEILGRKKNGYHNIKSVIVPISLFDVLRLEKTSGVIETIIENNNLEIDNDDTRTREALEELFLTNSEANLATRAAVALKQATGYPEGARIYLQKNIPVGGGLGGGSSDAAAVLTGLNRLWKTGMSREKLVEIGFGLGSDVPAMLHCRAVRVAGCGEKVAPVRARRGVSDESSMNDSEYREKGRDGTGWRLVMINPGVRVSTRDIYSRYIPPLTFGQGKFRDMILAVRTGNVDLATENLANGLQETVFRKYPLIGMAAERLEQAGAIGVLLCGSGGSVFGLARDEKHAQTVAQRVAGALGTPVWIRIAESLPDGVMAAHGPLEA